MADVIFGKDDWLFLTNDTNRSVDQFTGKLRLADEVKSAWATYEETARAECNDRGITYQFMIAPSKESVFPIYYPYDRAPDTATDDVLEAVGGGDALYPIHELAAVKNSIPTYPKTDTHWTDHGAGVGANSLLARLQLPTVDLAAAPFAERPLRLDLGKKCQPERVEDVLTLKGGYGTHLALDNLIHNTGRLWVYDNPGAPVQETCVLFGDSFSVQLCMWLPRIFSRMIYLHSVHIDWSVVDREKPKYLVREIAERFIIAKPNLDKEHRVLRMMADKLRQSDPQKRELQLTAIRTYFGAEEAAAFGL